MSTMLFLDVFAQLLLWVCVDRFAYAHRPTASNTSTRYKEATSHRLTQVGILRALTWPGFFLSTFLGSRVMVPAGKRLAFRFETRWRDGFDMLRGLFGVKVSGEGVALTIAMERLKKQCWLGDDETKEIGKLTSS